MQINIFDAALQNTDYREVIKTGVDSQIVVMSLRPGENVGDEVYVEVDQSTVIVEGKAEYAIRGGESGTLEEQDLLFVTGGKSHYLRNIGDSDLKLFTIYAPPELQPNTVQETKQDAMIDSGEVPMDEQDLYGDEFEDTY